MRASCKKGGIIMQTAKTTASASAGELRISAALPTATHQSIAGCLLTEISVYLKAREPKCRAVAAPFAVFFQNSGRDCVQPDIVVVQDEEKLDEEGCHGAPDWVIEIVSPDSRELDYGQKLGIYINEGVREYWIVDPEKKLIVAYYLEHPDVPVLYHFGDIAKPAVYPDLVIDSSLLARIQYRKAAGQPAAGPQVDPQAAPGDPYRAGRPVCQETSEAEDGDEQETITDPADVKAFQQEHLTDPAEIKAFLQEHFADLAAAKNKGQLLKAAMGALKGRAESSAVNEAVAELCR